MWCLTNYTTKVTILMHRTTQGVINEQLEVEKFDINNGLSLLYSSSIIHKSIFCETI